MTTIKEAVLKESEEWVMTICSKCGSNHIYYPPSDYGMPYCMRCESVELVRILVVQKSDIDLTIAKCEAEENERYWSCVNCGKKIREVDLREGKIAEVFFDEGTHQTRYEPGEPATIYMECKDCAKQEGYNKTKQELIGKITEKKVKALFHDKWIEVVPIKELAKLEKEIVNPNKKHYFFSLTKQGRDLINKCIDGDFPCSGGQRNYCKGVGVDCKRIKTSKEKKAQCGLCRYYNPFKECEMKECPPEAYEIDKAVLSP